MDTTTPSIMTINTGTNTIKTYEPLPIFNHKNPHLADRLSEYDFVHSNLSIEQLKDIVKRMEATMLKHGGMGLAANQVGLKLRMFVMTGETVTACVNPEICGKSETTNREREGCLTFPYLYLPVTRPDWIDVQWYDIFGVPQKARFSGLTARVFCHELDHLNGIVFTSLVGTLTLSMAKKKRDKMLKKIARMTELKQAQKV